MNRHEDRARAYLEDMLEALSRITTYTEGVSEEQFLANRMVQDAVIRNIEIVGEAAKQLLAAAPEFCSNHPEIPLARVYGMRNRLIHGYSSVNPDLVWDTVVNDVPDLSGQLTHILANIEM